MNTCVIGLLVAALMTSPGCDIMKKRSSAAQMPAQKTVEDLSSAQDIDLAKSLVFPEPRSLSFDRDVFRPLVNKKGLEGFVSVSGPQAPTDEVSLADLVLSATFLSDVSVAFITDSKQEKGFVVREGQRVGNFIVKKIKRSEVILEVKGKEMSLKNLEEEK